MAHWREEYSAALAARDRREKANTALYDAYTNLADRTARSATTSSTNPTTSTSTALPPASTTTELSNRHYHPQTPSSTTTTITSTEETLLASTRADLAAAQRSRTSLQTQLTRVTADLDRLRKQSTQNTKRIQASEQEIARLQMRLKDRDEELRGKAKLLEDFQDEMATLNLQLNMAEERKAHFEEENMDLTQRLLALKNQAADNLYDRSNYS
ncbi:ATG16 family protein [Aspergillus saccharolyticus JOP 1030-1]|uniref:Autophagy protein 16 n=1 Tax=Aspergillus saccharolyticus JOP 1030-1 TaxID=1450539 RepID=A0A318ZDE5_9EURO|nr:autophagy protein 16 [Aspergillus saccharolyticus JOP 1030-1]PYH44597.1 autophagy protein 16 [Aspergillus saccharolyticus JOP 1030-1]